MRDALAIPGQVGQDAEGHIGVLILSQFAGAAEQLRPDALLVNPYDIEQMADAILKAFRMSNAERSARMKRMRGVVRNENVFWWVDSFLKAGAKVSAQSVQVSNRLARGKRAIKRGAAAPHSKMQARKKDW